jgi:hypothetical protein
MTRLTIHHNCLRMIPLVFAVENKGLSLQIHGRSFTPLTNWCYENNIFLDRPELTSYPIAINLGDTVRRYLLPASPCLTDTHNSEGNW